MSGSVSRRRSRVQKGQWRQQGRLKDDAMVCGPTQVEHTPARKSTSLMQQACWNLLKSMVAVDSSRQCRHTTDCSDETSSVAHCKCTGNAQLCRNSQEYGLETSKIPVTEHARTRRVDWHLSSARDMPSMVGNSSTETSSSLRGMGSNSDRPANRALRRDCDIVLQKRPHSGKKKTRVHPETEVRALLKGTRR